MITSKQIKQKLESISYLGYAIGPSANRWRITKEDPNIHPFFQFTAEKRNDEGIYVYQQSFKTYYEALEYIQKETSKD